MPYTEKQRRMFCAKAKSDPEMAKLCKEAKSLPVKRKRGKS